MIVSGLWLLVFMVIHAKAFRFSPSRTMARRGARSLSPGNGERLAIRSVAFYVLSMVVVGSHLWHGIASALQSLGAEPAAWTPRLLVAGKVLAVLIAGAFMVIAVWAYMQQGGRVRV